MITSARHDKVANRNSSFFKPYRPEVEDIEEHVFPTIKPKILSQSQQIDPDIIIEGREESTPKILNHEIVESANASDSITGDINQQSVKKKKRGRPTAKQTALNKDEREKESALRRASNLHVRESKRLAEKKNMSKGGG